MEIKSLPDSLVYKTHKIGYYKKFKYLWNGTIIYLPFIWRAINEFNELDKAMQADFIAWYILKFSLLSDMATKNGLEADIWAQILWSSMLIMLGSEKITFTRRHKLKEITLSFPDTSIESMKYSELIMDECYRLLQSKNKIQVKKSMWAIAKFQWQGTEESFSIVKKG